VSHSGLFLREGLANNTFAVDEDARPLAAKYLVKWRPGFIESQTRAPGGDAASANSMAIAA
jgi:hypothetical protein